MNTIIESSQINKKKYKLLILIVSSDCCYAYTEMKRISNEYMKLYTDQIKYLYIDYDINLQDDIKEEGNILYVKVQKSIIPGMFQYTMKALDYVNKMYDFDFLLRTSLSTFLYMENILKYINNIPDKNFIGGFPIQTTPIITGTGIFMSKDIIPKITDIGLTPEFYYNTNMNEDVLIYEIIKCCNIPINYIENEYIMTFITQDNISNEEPYNPNITYPDNTLYFRIKYVPDRMIDVMYFKLLIKQIYNIDV